MSRGVALASFLFGSAAVAETAPRWNDVVETARGGTVNFFLWGGSDSINRYVSDYIGGRLKSEYGITLNRVPLTDTVEAVNIVLGERDAGVTTGGAVDLIWINGENFRTMKEGGIVTCMPADLLPNMALVDPADPTMTTDFGTPVDGCEVPWSRAQFAFAYDSAALAAPPGDMAALLDWIRANPGRFTYPAPPDFTGSVFVRHVFYHAAGGHEALLGPFDQARFDAIAPRAWEILNGIEPFLWREGATYPTSVTALNDLFANGEVAFTFNYDPAQFALAVEAGTYPPTTRSFGLTDGTIGNVNFTAIPFNAANAAAALVTQNLLLSPDAQLQKALPEVWGAASVLDPARLDADGRAAFAALPLHPSVIAPADLARAALPELQAGWITAIEDGWIAHVGNAAD